MGINRLSARDRFDLHRPRILAVASVLTVGVQVETTDMEVAAMTGIHRNAIQLTRRLMVAMGVLDHQPGHWKTNAGKWTLRVAGEELRRAIDLEMERQMRGGLSPEGARKKTPKKSRRLTRRSQEQVAVTEDRLGFPVGAVAGPERPNPLAPLAGAGPNAPAALVMAAKQYRAGATDESVRKARALVKELNEIGVSVPPELAEKATIKKDDRLEAIGLVLPYIEQIERQLVIANDTIRSQADYGQLRQINEKQKHQIERLVAERTAQAMGERPRT